jgi:hypothetical protein
MTEGDVNTPESDAAVQPETAGAPVPAGVLLLGMVVVPAVVLGLASAGSWLGVFGIVVVLASVVAVIVRWSARW